MYHDISTIVLTYVYIYIYVYSIVYIYIYIHILHMATSSYLWNRMKGFSQAGPKIGGTGQPLEGFTTVKVPNGTIAQAGKRHGTWQLQVIFGIV